MKFRNGLLVLLAVAVCIAAIVWGCTYTAHADTYDDAFITTLDQGGVTYPDRQYAIDAGHGVCEALDGGYTQDEVVTALDEGSQMDTAHANYFLGASIAAYCPQHDNFSKQIAA